MSARPKCARDSAWIGCQSFLNISVALKLLPTKGITLPFISAGGTSLVAVMMAIGILLNVSSQGSGRNAREV
ncbi:MAG: hypothetical protein EBZ36_15980 [Acidobacteria bacterium]|nr:hypothetical protein [Acidobacteriota bacterium]